MKVKGIFFAAILAAVLCISGTVPAACPSADLSGDCRVDLDDLSLLAGQWLTAYDDADLMAMASQWLTEGIPNPNPDITWVSVAEAVFTGQMSVYETTNAQYCQYLNVAKAAGLIVVHTNNKIYAASDTGHSYPYYDLAGPGSSGGAARINYTGGSFTYDDGFENHPVTYVSWYGAMAFCSYYGIRLPNEWEWQAVANFDGTFIYGCGLTINNTIANYYGTVHPYGTTVVGAFSTYGYGMADMAGNVAEWTSSCYYSGCTDGTYVYRGGSWGVIGDVCVVGGRPSTSPAAMNHLTGFRVCR
jgi:formylglycine-generating enzyme required for sulfatase activity